MRQPQYPYSVHKVCFDNKKPQWVAFSKVLTHCVGQGDTIEEATNELCENEETWLEVAKMFNDEDMPVITSQEKAEEIANALKQPRDKSIKPGYPPNLPENAGKIWFNSDK